VAWGRGKSVGEGGAALLDPLNPCLWPMLDLVEDGAHAPPVPGADPRAPDPRAAPVPGVAHTRPSQRERVGEAVRREQRSRK
jgi:hypothetical protein